MTPSEAVSALSGRFQVLEKTEFRGETSLNIPRESLHAVCTYCRDELGFDYLVDITGIDHFGDEPRYEIAYELCILESETHLRLRTSVSEDDLTVASVMDIWPTANWHEREVFDMMGIVFEGHNDLRRILMWEGYPFYPLRKDFPLQGKPSDVPNVAFSSSAPLAGGPFVTAPTEATTIEREPRAREAGDLPPGSAPPQEN